MFYPLLLTLPFIEKEQLLSDWNMSGSFDVICSFIVCIVIHLSSYHEKATKRCTSSLRSCQPSVHHTKMGESR